MPMRQARMHPPNGPNGPNAPLDLPSPAHRSRYKMYLSSIYDCYSCAQQTMYLQ